MTAEEYITQHWIPNRTWEHLGWAKHQKRLRLCTEPLIGTTFADVGCACGHSTKIMQGFKNGTWHGVDFSETAIKMARELFPELTFSVGLDGAIFDSIVCSEVIEHVEDNEAFIGSLIKATKHVLLLTTPATNVDDPGHLRLYNLGMLTELVQKYGDFNIRTEDGYYYIIVRKDEQNG